jgi:multidrug efflux pump
MKPLEAALKGSAQVGFTIVSLTVSLIAVLIPLLFMGDVVGRLFREFAITLSVTILFSAVVSLTLVPMLCAKILRRTDEATETGFARRSRKWFDALIRQYDSALNWVLDRQGLTLLVALATLVVTGLLYVAIPKGFFPTQDTGVIQGISQAEATVSYDAMARAQEDLAAAILKDPDVVSLTSFIGVDGTNTTLNSGRFLINLRPKDDRTLNATAIAKRLGQETADVQGVTLYLQPVQDLTIDSTVGRAQYQFILGAAASETLRPWVPKLLDRLARAPELANVSTNFVDSGLTVQIDIDRDTAARFGVTAATIDNVLYDAFGQRIISTIYTQSNEYRVIMEGDPKLQTSIDSLNDIYVPSATSGSGGQVPLGSIARISVQDAPLEIDHLGQFPAAMFSFDTAPSASLENAVNAVRAAEQAVGLPVSITTTFEGAALAFQSSLRNEVLLILAAIVTVYIVLGVLYESYIHPLTILSTLPSAGIGALLALMIAGLDLNIISIIGIILLIGIVKKNAIMMIDFALTAERAGGKSPREAIHEAALLRFRPILMTTLAALFAALPLMLGSGTGKELRAPLGIAIVGGLLVSQLLTLFTTPVIYLFFDRLAADVRRRRGKIADQDDEGQRPLGSEPGPTPQVH